MDFFAAHFAYRLGITRTNSKLSKNHLVSDGSFLSMR